MPTPQRYTARDGSVTWKVRFRRGGHNTSETFDSRVDALIFCTDIEERGADEAVRRLERALFNRDGALTLNDLFEEWIERKARNVRSDRTVADYRRDWRNWTAPSIGRIPAATVTVQDVQAWIDSMVPHLSGKSIGDRRAVLHAVCKWGMSPARQGGQVIAVDPCVGVEAPGRQRPQPKGLMPAEWGKLYAALQARSQDGADLALFLVGTGWRWSEATALTNYAVEDNGQTVHVSTGWVIRRNADGVFERVQDTKTASSRRRTLLDPELAEMVRRRLPVDGSERPVFTAPQGGFWRYSSYRRSVWNPAVKAAGLDGRGISPHGLRHTHAGWLLLTGAASLVDVSRRMGHSSIKTTVDIYGSLVSDAPVEAISAVAAMRGSTPPAIGQ